MSHSSDVSGEAGRSAAGDPSVTALTEAPNGEVHLLVTFGIRTADQRTDGGDGELPRSTFVVSGGEGELVDDRESASGNEAPDGQDSSNGGDSSSHLGVADCEPFLGSVMRPEASNSECADTAFGELVDVESLVSYLGMDFVEHELFVDRFLPESADVVYTSRGVGTYQLLCVYSVDRGLLVVVDEGESIQPLVDHARSLLTES